MTITKTFDTLKQAERFHNSLYNKYNYVRATRSPRFTEQGIYAWEVKDEIVKKAAKPAHRSR
jgi:hypothetical protein